MRLRRRSETRSGFRAAAWLVVCAAPFFVAAGFYSTWRADRFATLEAGSGLTLLPEGVMEYAVRGDGPVVLVIHGSPGGYDQGLVYGAELERRGFRVLSVSRPGYLRTPLETGVTMEDQADAIDSLMNSLGFRNCAVMGISEGSSCALQLAGRHPSRVTTIVLLSPLAASLGYGPIASLGYSIFHDLTGDLGCWLLSLRMRFDTAAAFALMMPVGSSLKPSRCSSLAAEANEDPAQRAFLCGLEESITPLSPREPGIINDNAQLKDMPALPAGSVTSPLLVVTGEEERHSTFKSLQTLVQEIPGARLRVIPRVGHILPIGEDFRTTWDGIAAFLKAGGEGYPGTGSGSR